MTPVELARVALQKMGAWGVNRAPMEEVRWPDWFRDKVIAYRAAHAPKPTPVPAPAPTPAATALKKTVAKPPINSVAGGGMTAMPRTLQANRPGGTLK